MTTQLSEFGKFVRIGRLECGKSMKQMADFAGVTSAYLSAIETGRKEVTEKVVEAVAAFLGYDEDQTDKLHAMASRSNGKVRIDLEDLDDSGAEVATLFARYGSKLPAESMKLISDTVKKEIEKNKGTSM